MSVSLLWMKVGQNKDGFLPGSSTASRKGDIQVLIAAGASLFHNFLSFLN
jgi:hypothetical protein